MKLKDILEVINGEVQKIPRTFQYDPSSIRDLSGSDGIDVEGERKFLREVKEIAADEIVCARCLKNSDERVSLKGREFCPMCGAKKNPNMKGESE